MVQQLKSPKIDFLQNMFLQYGMSTESNEMVGFEEFKDFYNTAKDDAAGRRQRKPPRGPGPFAAEAEEGARKVAEEAERIRQENLEMKRRIAAKMKAPPLLFE